MSTDVSGRGLLGHDAV